MEHLLLTSDYPSFLEQLVYAPVVVIDEQKNKQEVGNCCSFSHGGSYLAVGSVDSGRVVIHDMLTRNPIAAHRCHKKTVTGVAYLPNRNDRYIVTASVDGYVKIFDLDNFECKYKHKIGKKIYSLSLNETGDLCCVSQQDCPLLVDLRDSARPPIELRRNVEQQPQKQMAIIAQFLDQDLIIAGGVMGGGEIDFFNSQGEYLKSKRFLDHQSKGQVRKMVLARNKKSMLVQMNEKVILLVMIDWNSDHDLAIKNRFSESVENIKWSTFAFSNDGEYVVGGDSKAHVIHIWNVLGRHMATLRGPMTGLVRALSWHPTRTQIVSIGKDGRLALWGAPRMEKWTAFAPNFIPLEENTEYEEREDEFDKNRFQETIEQNILNQQLHENNAIDVVDDDDDKKTSFHSIPFDPNQVFYY